MGRVMAVVLALALALALASCGGDEEGAAGARYLDAQSDWVVSVSLDYDSDDWNGIKRLYAELARSGELSDWFGTGGAVPPTLDGALGLLAGSAGLSFEDDIRPLLGGELLIGVHASPAVSRERGDTADLQMVAVYEVSDSDALERVIEKLGKQGLRPKPIDGVDDARSLGDGVAVVGGDTLVLADEDAQLRNILQPEGDGPAVPELGDHLVAMRFRPRLLAAVLDTEEVRRALEESTAGRALRGGSATLDVTDAELAAAATVDFDGLSDEELPFGPPGPLALPTGEAIASAAADQQHTTVFLERLARELFPDSAFIRRSQAFERKEGIRFADEVLRAFSGPSATILRPDLEGNTQFAARSSLADPERMRELLPRLTPALPDILEGLQALGRGGLSALLFAAPDAPLTPMAASILAAIRVTPLPRTADAQLYEVRGLDPDNREPLPDALVYGLIGDVFVVGSTRELAEQAARMPTEEAEPAGARLVVDVDRLSELLGTDLTEALRAVVSRAELAASARDGDLRVDGRVSFRP